MNRDCPRCKSPPSRYVRMKIATGTASIFDAATTESQREESAVWAESAGVPNNTASMQIDRSRQNSVVMSSAATPGCMAVIANASRNLSSYAVCDPAITNAYRPTLRYLAVTVAATPASARRPRCVDLKRDRPSLIRELGARQPETRPRDHVRRTE